MKATIKNCLTFIFQSKKNCIILCLDYHVSIIVLSQDEFLHKYYETAHAVWSMVKSEERSMQSGLGWDDNPGHNKGVYQR